MLWVAHTWVQEVVTSSRTSTRLIICRIGMTECQVLMSNWVSPGSIGELVNCSSTMMTSTLKTCLMSKLSSCASTSSRKVEAFYTRWRLVDSTVSQVRLFKAIKFRCTTALKSSSKLQALSKTFGLLVSLLIKPLLMRYRFCRTCTEQHLLTSV